MKSKLLLLCSMLLLSGCESSAVISSIDYENKQIKLSYENENDREEIFQKAEEFCYNTSGYGMKAKLLKEELKKEISGQVYGIYSTSNVYSNFYVLTFKCED